jgi:putative phage-type endonuclease
MKILDAAQGTEEWLKERRKYFTASAAPAMMGVSKTMTRDELLRELATGYEKEHSKFVKEVVFSRGHAVEKAARIFAARIIGEEVFPATATDDEDYLLASFDGLTMDDSTGWECKQFSKKKLAEMEETGEIPVVDFWQVVQQTAVGAKQVLYMLTDGKEECHTIMYKRNDNDIARLKAGWKQLEADLAEYQLPEEGEPVVGEAQASLPTVSVRVSGAIDVTDNFDVFERALRTFLDEQLITEPETDEDFATLDLQVKALKEAEAALDAAETLALGQVASIDAIKRRKDMLHEMARKNRLMAEKLVTAKKKEIRAKIVNEAKEALSAHIAGIDATLDIRLPAVHADFAGAIKGKRTVASCRSAANDELARAKIEANHVADDIRINLKALQDLAADYRFLFHDIQSIAAKTADDFVALVKVRIQEHKEAEEKRREAERIEAERAEEEKRRREEAEKQPQCEEKDKGVEVERTEEASPAAETESQKFQSPPEWEPPAAAHNDPQPSDAAIIDILAYHFNVHESKVIWWLSNMDLEAASENLKNNF